MSGISLLIIGFSFVTRNGCEFIPLFGVTSLNPSVQYPGTAPATLGLIMGGMIFLALGHVYEIRTSREALFPPQLFKDISCGTVTFLPHLALYSRAMDTVSILVVVFLHSFCFTAGTFYITIYFQVRF